MRRSGAFDAVIADFGLATNIHLQEYIYVRCGTPGFIAPEIIYHTGKSGQSSTSDIFSLGVVAHILATDSNPFIGRNCHETLAKNNAAILKLGQDQYKKVNPLLINFIVRAIERDPSKRMTSEELLEDPLFSTDSPCLLKIGTSTTVTDTKTSLLGTNNQGQGECLMYKPDLIMVSDSVTIITPEEAKQQVPRKERRKRIKEVIVDSDDGESPRKRLHKAEEEGSNPIHPQGINPIGDKVT